LSALATAGRWLAKEIRLVLPPTIYFFCAFNVIVFTTNLLARHYWFALQGFLFATVLALVVGKVILVVNHFSIVNRFRDAPLIQPILYKTVFYTVVVGLVRLLEQLVDVARDGRGFDVAFRAALDAFTWQRFTAIQVWLFVCFLIYVTVTELGALLGEGQLMRLFFRPRSQTLARDPAGE
jgi:hypothetical protein